MNIPGFDQAVVVLRTTLADHPELKLKAANLGKMYEGRRGLMVVDVVASRQRRYETYVVPKLLPLYESQATDISLEALAATAPTWLPIKTEEPETMREVARRLLEFGLERSLKSDDEICLAWANDPNAVIEMREVFGIGPALLEYLRMLCGADSLKVDVRVIDGLSHLGIETDWFTSDGILALSKELSSTIPCSLLELDQCLWHVLGK